MDPNITAAIIGGVAGLAAAGTERGLEFWNKRRERIAEINARHLNPIRLYCEETYFRLREINQALEKNDGHCSILLSVSSASEISEKKPEWFNGYGCYLASSCYFTACLFSAMKKVREEMPYLQLRSGDDTTLLNRMFAVSHAFLSEIGIFYVIQHTIGAEMWKRAESRFISYREFCELLIDCERRIWFDRLLQFYLEMGKGARRENVLEGLHAVRKLGMFVDNAAKGSDSIDARLKAEGIRGRNY